ncbi:MAG: hypothetical protein ACI4WG_04855 [Erysipelotrichaceae bacterium]
MKKLDLIIYQFILSAILLGFGLLFEFKSVDNTPWVSTIFLIIPGATIALGIFLSFFKRITIKSYVVISFVLSAIAEVALVVTFKLYGGKAYLYICMALAWVLGNVISLMFGILYAGLRPMKSSKEVTKLEIEYDLTSQD